MDARTDLLDVRRHDGSRALVVLGGDPLDAAAARHLPDHSIVIAADSGVDQAHRLGLEVDLAIGDFDSVSGAGLERVRRRGARIVEHPAEKDATDFELALGAALDLGVAAATVVGGEGGRIDHLLANALLMASPRFEALELSALGADGARLHVVRGLRRLVGEPGELVTLLAVNGPATGVTTTGLRYPLCGDELRPGSSRGVSNQLLAHEATVTVEVGVLLAVLPGLAHTVAATVPPPSERTAP
jgi:thiamine pyrophosphokinase